MTLFSNNNLILFSIFGHDKLKYWSFFCYSNQIWLMVLNCFTQ